MDLATMEVLTEQRQQQLRAEADVRRRVRAARGPEVHRRRVGNVIEMASSNPAATSRLLLSGGAVVIDHDERNGCLRTIFANRDRTHFWVVTGI